MASSARAASAVRSSAGPCAAMSTATSPASTACSPPCNSVSSSKPSAVRYDDSLTLSAPSRAVTAFGPSAGQDQPAAPRQRLGHRPHLPLAGEHAL